MVGEVDMGILMRLIFQPPPPKRRINLFSRRFGRVLWPPLWSGGQSSWLQIGDVLCFLWGTNWIYIRVCYVEESRPPLWFSGQSSWLQIQRSGFDSRLYQIFWEIVGLERSPLTLVSTTEELLGRKRSGSGLESREFGRRDPSRSGGRSFGIVRSWTQAMEFFFEWFLFLFLV
jgi:hypothetical protein